MMIKPFKSGRAITLIACTLSVAVSSCAATNSSAQRNRSTNARGQVVRPQSTKAVTPETIEPLSASRNARAQPVQPQQVEAVRKDSPRIASTDSKVNPRGQTVE